MYINKNDSSINAEHYHHFHSHTIRTRRLRSNNAPDRFVIFEIFEILSCQEQTEQAFQMFEINKCDILLHIFERGSENPLQVTLKFINKRKVSNCNLEIFHICHKYYAMNT